jgi:hypothetical protein
MAIRHGLPPAEQLQAIGAVSVEYQRLEALITAAIWGLSTIYGDEKDTVAAMIAPLNLDARINIVRTLFRLQHHDDDDLNHGLERLCGKMQQVAGRRAEVIDAEWLSGDRDTSGMLSVRIRSGELKRSGGARSADWITAIAQDVSSVAEEVEKFFYDHSVVELDWETA